jgi:hypothetical protein
MASQQLENLSFWRIDFVLVSWKISPLSRDVTFLIFVETKRSPQKSPFPLAMTVFSKELCTISKTRKVWIQIVSLIETAVIPPLRCTLLHAPQKVFLPELNPYFQSLLPPPLLLHRVGCQCPLRRHPLLLLLPSQWHRPHPIAVTLAPIAVSLFSVATSSLWKYLWPLVSVRKSLWTTSFLGICSPSFTSLDDGFGKLVIYHV